TASVDVERFAPNIDGRGLFNTESPDAHDPFEWSAGLVLQYARRPFVLRLGSTRIDDLVANRLGGDLLLSLGLLRWLEIGAALPFALANDQNATLGGGSVSAGLGTMRFQIKFRLLREGIHGLGLAIQATLALPTGDHDASLA